jgi:hypothetical protein
MGGSEKTRTIAPILSKEGKSHVEANILLRIEKAEKINSPL